MTTWPDRGVHEGVLETAYHGLVAASASGLKLLAKRSPAHLRWQLDHGSEPREVFRVGTLSHLVFLEPHRIEDRLLLCPLDATGERLDKRSNAAKAEWAEAEARAEQESRVIVTPGDLRMILGMARALQGHSTARSYLAAPGPRELSLRWLDPEFDVECKARYDLLCPAIGAVVDLKFVEDASPVGMGKHIADWGYDISAAWYLDAAAHVGLDADEFRLICIEKKPPHAIAVYPIYGAILALGRRDARAALARYATCAQTGVWPAYGDGELEPVYPGWMWRQRNAMDLLIGDGASAAVIADDHDDHQEIEEGGLEDVDF